MAGAARQIPAGSVPDVGALEADDAGFLRQIHRAIAQVSDDLEKFRFNSAVAHIRELSNAVEDMNKDGGDARVFRFGVETVARKTFSTDAARLLALAAERKAAGFVLGLPINMDGSEGPRAQSTRAFARNLSRLTELPIGLWDERLSTAAVERDLVAADVSRAKRAEVIDQHAAAFILQGALDRLQNLDAAHAKR